MATGRVLGGDAGYIRCTRNPVQRGRDFSEADQYEAPFTAIINEALRAQGISRSGSRSAARSIAALKGPAPETGDNSEKPMKIIGIVGDVRQFGPAVEPWPEIYNAERTAPGELQRP